MRPQPKQTPLVVWIVVFLLATALQIPVVMLYQQAATADRDFPATRRVRRKVKARLVNHPRPVARPVVEKHPDDVIKGQVVTVRRPPEEVVPPKNTRRLAEFNTSVKVETKAPASRERKRRMGAPSTAKDSRVQSPKATSDRPTTARKKAEKPEQPRRLVRKVRVQKRGDVAARTDLARAARSKALRLAVSREASHDNLQKLLGDPGSDDALLDVSRRDSETRINARQYRHWGFFDRVKRRVRKHWKPAQQYRRRDPTGRIYGTKDRLTILMVTLNEAGTLKRLTTVKNSGVGFLDDEARRALNRAAPFVNPPRGLLNRHKEIVFKVGFLFEISTSRFRFFRIPM